MTRRTTLILALAALLLLAAVLAYILRTRKTGEEEEGRLALIPATFADLPGWRDDDVAAALPPLLRSCARMGKLPDDAPLGGTGFAGTAADWRSACAAAAKVPKEDQAATRAFFEEHFRPFAAGNAADRGERTGLFTGYYEALLRGSRKRGGRYTVPLYSRPADLVSVDLGKFREDLRGRRLAGRILDGELVPYADREEIEKGALAGRGLELVWVDDPIGAFFLQIQGSGRVRLAEGGEMRVGYAAENGHPYFAIGRDLVERKALRVEEVSMQSIRSWLEAHPQLAPEVLARNASYVFFDEIRGEGPLGAEGVPLTPGPLARRGPQALAPRRPRLARRRSPGAQGGRSRPPPPAPARRPGHRRSHPRPGPRRRLLGSRPRCRRGRGADEASGENVGAAAAVDRPFNARGMTGLPPALHPLDE